MSPVFSVIHRRDAKEIADLTKGGTDVLCLPRPTMGLFLTALLSIVTASAEDATSSLGFLISETRWVAFAPTGYDPIANPPRVPSDDSIRVDLRTLRNSGFDGLITYGAELTSLVRLASEEGFSAVLLGVWDPSNSEEITLAIKAARDSVVKGIIVGNEGLTFQRYSVETLRDAMEDLRREAGKPVSTTEVVEMFYTHPDLIEWSDFVTVNAHAYFHGHRDPVRAVDWTFGAWNRLKRQIPDKPILFKEVGLPTAGGAEDNEENQREFYFSLLTTTEVQFAFFEAFDQLFKPGQLEKSWGVFRADRSPKPAAGVLLDSESCTGPLMRSWCKR